MVLPRSPYHHELDERARRRLEANVERLAREGRPAIDRRIRELEREWDVDRVLDAQAAGLGLAGLAMGAALNRRRWLFFPATVAGLLFAQALYRGSPPAALLRRIGVRTAREIHEERYALKALRGDFKNAHAPDQRLREGGAALAAARRR